MFPKSDSLPFAMRCARQTKTRCPDPAKGITQAHLGRALAQALGDVQGEGVHGTNPETKP